MESIPVLPSMRVLKRIELVVTISNYYGYLDTCIKTWRSLSRYFNNLVHDEEHIFMKNITAMRKFIICKSNLSILEKLLFMNRIYVFKYFEFHFQNRNRLNILRNTELFYDFVDFMEKLEDLTEDYDFLYNCKITIDTNDLIGYFGYIKKFHKSFTNLNVVLESVAIDQMTKK
jgi:hypothetical protein